MTIDMAVAMNPRLEVLLKDPKCPDSVKALFVPCLPEQHYMINALFQTLRKHPMLWTMLPRMRRQEMLDKMIEYCVQKWSCTPPKSAGKITHERFALPCAVSLMTHRGPDPILRTMQTTVFERLAILDARGAPFGSVTGITARTLLLHGSLRDDGLKQLFETLAARHPDIFQESVRIAEVLQARSSNR